MKEHEQRVVKEYQELVDKALKLNDFIGGDIFPTLSSEEQRLLILQHSAMTLYVDVLYRRLEIFYPENVQPEDTKLEDTQIEN